MLGIQKYIKFFNKDLLDKFVLNQFNDRGCKDMYREQNVRVVEFNIHIYLRIKHCKESLIMF